MLRAVAPAAFTSIHLPRRSFSPRQTCRIEKSIYRVFVIGRLPFPTLAASSSFSAIPQEENAPEDDNVFDVVNAPEKGALWDGTIKSYNRGGVIIKAGTRRAFCPYSRLDPVRQEEIDFTQRPFECTAILNKPIKCVVTDIDELGRVVVSEIAYWTRRALDFYKPGDVVTCTVKGLATLSVAEELGSSVVLVHLGVQDYGAFVTIPSEDGIDHGVSGLIHVSELSWDMITRPEDVVQIGDEVKAFVKQIKRFSNQFELSLRHEASDPLKENISSLLPLEGPMLEDMRWEPPRTLLRELTFIVDTLKAEDGIEDVRPTRQAEVQHKVSLDLELWLSKDEVEDGFNLVAWSGRTLQEIHVTTDFTREEMKSTLREVLRRTM